MSGKFVRGNWATSVKLGGAVRVISQSPYHNSDGNVYVVHRASDDANHLVSILCDENDMTIDNGSDAAHGHRKL